MSTAQVQEADDSLVHSWKIYDLYQHVVTTCPFCHSIEPRPERYRVSGLRAEELGDLIFLDHGSAKIVNKTLGFLVVLDGATSHFTAYPCKSTSPSGVISKLHEWVDTFQMNPKAICADMAFHQPHDMQAFYRMPDVKRLPTGPQTPWPHRLACLPNQETVRVRPLFCVTLFDLTTSEVYAHTNCRAVA